MRLLRAAPKPQVDPTSALFALQQFPPDAACAWPRMRILSLTPQAATHVAIA